MANVRAGGWLFSKPYSSRYAQFVPPHSGGVNLFTFFFESGAHYVFQFLTVKRVDQYSSAGSLQA